MAQGFAVSVVLVRSVALPRLWGVRALRYQTRNGRADSQDELLLRLAFGPGSRSIWDCEAQWFTVLSEGT